MSNAVSWPLALLCAGAVALAAWRFRSLRGDGAVAATMVGTLALVVGWSWGLYLIGWFVSASVLSRVGRARKLARTEGVVAKGDRRDALQVLANGGVFAFCALLVLIARATSASANVVDMATIAAVAALAAAGADTWSTEVGTLWGGAPYSLRERRVVPPGTSGAVTAIGTVGGAVGAIILTMFATTVGLITPLAAIPVALGGVAGALADTAIGAWWQERRVCPLCEEPTERRYHRCGTETIRAGGITRLDNDVVNALCTFVGAMVSVALATAFR